MRRPTGTFILALIVTLYVVIAALYAVRTPKWQAPDEPAHFNYVRTIAETGTLPVLQPGDYDHDYLERIKAEKFPPAMPVDGIRYESYQPPLYYLAAAPIYLLARAGGLDAQVFALRVFSVALGGLVLLLAFAIVREVFPDDLLLPLATVGAVATLPMHLAVAASISNDMAAELVLAFVLLLALRRVHGKIADRQFVILGGVLFGAGLLTKTTTYLTGGLLLVAAELLHARAGAAAAGGTAWVRRLARDLIPLLALAFLIAAPMFIRNIVVYGIADPLGLGRHDMVVYGQPTTAEILTQRGMARTVADFVFTTFRSFWAQFGWMGVLVNDRIYVALFLLTGAAQLGLALYALSVARQRDRLSRLQWSSLGLFALLLVVAVVDYVGYNLKFYQPQGRYLFPALIPIACFLVLGLGELLAREHARILYALLYIALVGLDIAALFLYIVPQLAV